ncbi:MAG: four helix bundle protein [Bacteroidota bacterium]|jgi:four helix bundle protein
MLEKGNNVVQDKSYKFALRIIKLYQFLYNKKKEFVLSKQVLRSGTAVGALIEEGIHAESKSDFIHKINIAYKEAKETYYWIRLLRDSGIIDKKSSDSILNDCEELNKLLTQILITSRKNLKSTK